MILETLKLRLLTGVTNCVGNSNAPYGWNSELFEAASSAQSVEREALLCPECGGDEELRAMVERLPQGPNRDAYHRSDTRTQTGPTNLGFENR